MKKFTLSLIMFISVFYSYSQTGTYLVTFKADMASGTNTYSIIITDPTGLTTVQILADPIYDAVNHNTQVNQIYSNIYNLGYHLVPYTTDSYSNTDINAVIHVVKTQLFAPCCAP
jgi:hypothetical protein